MNTHHPDYSQSELPFDWPGMFTFYRFMAGNHNCEKQEGFYFRTLFNSARAEYCLQVVSYYRKQILVPYHKNDYHPFNVYFNSDFEPLRLLYDRGHHNAFLERANQHVDLTIVYPWHPFEFGRKIGSRKVRVCTFLLDDARLNSWWFQEGMPQFKLRTKFYDPWTEAFDQISQEKHGTFRDEAVCPVCGHVTELDEMDWDGAVFSLNILCENGHNFIATIDPATMQVKNKLT